MIMEENTRVYTLHDTDGKEMPLGNPDIVGEQSEVPSDASSGYYNGIYGSDFHNAVAEVELLKRRPISQPAIELP